MVIFQSYVSLPEGIVHFHGTSIYKWMTKGTPIVGNLHILDIPQNIGINATQMGSYLETGMAFVVIRVLGDQCGGFDGSTLKSSIVMGFFVINHPAIGVPP